MSDIYIWEILGIIVTFLFGSLLHFVYPLSGKVKLVAVFGSANESTWEHLKIAFWPFLVFSIIQYFFIGKYLSYFWEAKSVNTIVTMILIVVIYYSYKAILKKNYLPLDIGLFFFGIVIGHLTSYYLLINSIMIIPDPLGRIILILLSVCFASFTFITPRYFLFKDPTNGKYGIGSEQFKN